MNRVIFTIIILIGLSIAPPANAELKGKKVVFVHGLQFDAMLKLRFATDQEREDAVNAQSGDELDKIINARLYYNSAKRLDQNVPYILRQLNELKDSGDCRPGCYFITVSTGDVVTRYIIQNLRRWGLDNDIKVIASFDLVGAGGGTELADWGVAITEGNFVAQTLKSVVEAFVPGEFWLAGMGHNLRPVIARDTARQKLDVPHFRFAGRGKNEYGAITGAILKGGDDSVVPLHSACGSIKSEAIWSCSTKREMGGKHVYWTSGAGNFMHNHFPIIMARDMHHTQIDYQGIAVPLNNYRYFAGGSNIGGVNVSLKQKSWTTGRWWWKKTYTTIDKPSNQTLVGYFINEFN